VKSFLAGPHGVDALGSALPTCDAGTAWIFGRPYPLAPAGDLGQTSIRDRARIERFLSNLDGRFSGIFRCADGWVAATDILGCGPVYVREDGSSLAISTHLGHLVRLAPTTLDEAGCVALILSSICVAGRTPYAGISRLRPAEYLLFGTDFHRVQGRGRYFDFASSMGLDETHQGHPADLASLLREAVAREKDADALFLSGGLDSQAIALSLPQDRRSSIRTLSYGGWRSPDRRRGLQVGRLLGFESHAVGPVKLQPVDYWAPIVTLGGGQSGLQASQHVAGARAAKSIASCSLSGFLGDALTGHNADAESPEDVVARKLGHADPATIARISHLAPGLVGEVQSSVQAAFAEWNQLPLARGRAVANLHLRQSNYICGTFDLMHQEIDVATPFFHRPLMQYLLTRCDADLSGQRLYKRTLDAMGYVTPESGDSPLERHARAVEAKRGKYLTVDWSAVVRRSAVGVGPVVRRIEHPLLRAIANLPDPRRQPLPRWLFALPIAASVQPDLHPMPIRLEPADHE